MLKHAKHHTGEVRGYLIFKLKKKCDAVTNWHSNALISWGRGGKQEAQQKLLPKASFTLHAQYIREKRNFKLKCVNEM